MSSIVEDLDATLKRADVRVARKIERIVRQALTLADAPAGKTDANGWPEGYFERTAGCLAGEEFERPEQLPFEKREEW
ncbi:MAG: hypothetical protein DWH84_00815 [Planctomycetota bacterium]|nr:hypothetical protein [Planctomycetales bacterium]RLS47285.1 MAG: hypothetical protein DWH84_00815 [Planctomycetota bacterium]